MRGSIWGPLIVGPRGVHEDKIQKWMYHGEIPGIMSMLINHSYSSVAISNYRYTSI